MEKSLTKEFTKGILVENPVLRLVLGTCPTLAVTTAALNGLGMGVAALVVLVCSNAVISALRKVIPDRVRIPAYITIIATFVTVIQMFIKAYLPTINNALGIYLPLIVVNCIILGRAESYASKNNVLLSIFDGIGVGLGFTVGLTAIGIVRELLGSGCVFGLRVLPESYEPISIFILAPGAFFVLSILCAVMNKLTKGKKKEAKTKCSGNCANCANAEKEGK